MKAKHNRYLTACALAAAGLTTGSLFAQIQAPNGITLGLTGEISELPININNSTFGTNWFSGIQVTYAAPVGQFTGFDFAGAAIDPLDLIPLQPASITLNGETIFNWADLDAFFTSPDNQQLSIASSASGTVLSLERGGSVSLPKSEFLYARGTSTIYTGTTFSNFATSPSTFSSPTGSIAHSTNTVTLQPGKSYRLVFQPGFYQATSTPNAYTHYQWEEVSSGAVLGTCLASSPGVVGLSCAAPPLEVIVTPVVATTYRVRIVAYYSTTQTLGSSVIVQSL